MSDSNKFLNPKVIVPVLGLIVLVVAGTLIGVFYFRNPAVTDQLFNTDGSEGSGDSEHRLEAVTAEALLSESTTTAAYSTTHEGSTHGVTTSTSTTATSTGTLTTTSSFATSTLNIDHEATIDEPKLARAIEPVRHE